MSKCQTELDVINFAATATRWRVAAILQSVLRGASKHEEINWEYVEAHIALASQETIVLSAHRGITEELIACQLIWLFETKQVKEEKIRRLFGDDVLAMVSACSSIEENNPYCHFRRAGLYDEFELDQLIPRTVAAGSGAMAIRLAIEGVSVFRHGEYTFEGGAEGWMIRQAGRWCDEAVNMGDDSLAGLVAFVRSAMEM